MSANAVVTGQNVKCAREACGFSQANIADFLKVDQSLISKFEKGERSLQSHMLERLAILCGCKITDFDREAGIPELRIKAAYRSNGITPDDMEAIHDVRRIAMNLFFMADLTGGNSDDEQV